MHPAIVLAVAVMFTVAYPHLNWPVSDCVLKGKNTLRCVSLVIGKYSYFLFLSFPFLVSYSTPFTPHQKQNEN